MVTLYYQLCVNSQIYTDFVQVSPLNLCSTSWSRSYRPCFPFAKGKRLKYSFNGNFYLPTHFSGQLSDYRISFIQAGMTTRILRVLKNWNDIIFFLSSFGWDSTTGMVIKIALYLKLFRFLQFVVKQDKSSLCSSLSHLHCSRPPWLVCAPDQNRHAACRSQVHLLLSQFVALGETLLRTLTKAWKYVGTG